MTTENKLTKSEIHELALVYAHAKLSQALNSGTIRETGLQSKDALEMKYLFDAYKTATVLLDGIEKYEFN